MIREYGRCLRYSLVIWGVVLLFGSLLASSLGCIATLHGEGEVMFGMRNDNFFVIKHTTRALAPNSNSEAEVSITPIIENIINLKSAGVIGDNTTPEEEDD